MCLCTRFFISEDTSIKTNNKNNNPINEQIRFDDKKEVRLIGPDGEQIGLTAFSKALNLAYDRDLDLVLIAPQADPPVCRIMDYGKFCFERDKREKEARKKQVTVEIKEIQLTVRIDTNDFNTKVRRATGFLEKGNKVKVVVRFRGRQMAHQDLGRDLLAKFEEACSEYGVKDKPLVAEGRTVMMMLVPQKKQPAKSEPKPEENAGNE